MNCSQIFCTFAVETTLGIGFCFRCLVWIALKFFVLLQSKQHRAFCQDTHIWCELLSNFLYFCSRNNVNGVPKKVQCGVNCSQIFCTFAVETTSFNYDTLRWQVWIALKFFVLLQSKQPAACAAADGVGVNCSQIFCTFAVETTLYCWKSSVLRCELLSNFLYFCSRNNRRILRRYTETGVNCSQIFCTFAVETTGIESYAFTFRCELLSNFLYFCSRNNQGRQIQASKSGVNCSQIFCTFAVETTNSKRDVQLFWCELLSNFLYFCSRNNLLYPHNNSRRWCELLSNFLYFCSRNNEQLCLLSVLLGVNCSQIFCTFAVETTITLI